MITGVANVRHVSPPHWPPPTVQIRRQLNGAPPVTVVHRKFCPHSASLPVPPPVHTVPCTPVPATAQSAMLSSVPMWVAVKMPRFHPVAGHPVKVGLVASLNRPGGNATGVSVYTTELIAKRLELLRELVPRLASVALLVNPNNVVISDVEIRDMEAVAGAIGLRLLVLKAGAESEFEAACAAAAAQQTAALLISADPFFTTFPVAREEEAVGRGRGRGTCLGGEER